jgi:hypothetical protein
MKDTVIFQKLTNHTFYIAIFLVIQWIAIFILAMAAKPFYILILVPLLIGVSLYLSRKSKLLLALCCVSLYLGYVALFQEAPKNISFNKCFKFNVSYPGTKEYDQCVNSLTSADYRAEFFKL